MSHNSNLKKVVTAFASIATVFPMLASLALPSQAAFPDGSDPIASGCNDAVTLARTSGGSYTYGLLQRREIVVELRMSKKCRANWTKGDVPKGTTLFLKGEQGQVYVPYKTNVNGAGYTDMMNWNPPYSACAKLPSGNEVCTQLVR